MKRGLKIFFVFLFLFIFIFFVNGSFSKTENQKEKKIPGFDLKIPESSIKALKIQSMSSKSVQQEHKVIVTLKEPSSIPEWKNEVSNYKKDKINNLKSAIREYVINSEPNIENVKHKYASFNGFSATVSQEELEAIRTNPLVEKVEIDEKVYAFLQDSVPLINATTTWTNKVNGINLTGVGQTVCIIDTGVDYTHPDLGGCSPINIGTRTIEQYSLTSPNYPSEYNNDYYHEWIINKPGYSRISVYFSEIDLEEDYDYLYVVDSQDNYYWYTGYFSDFWTPSFEGDTVRVVLWTDETNEGGPYRGFNLSAIKNATTDSTLNWNSCSKVIGGHDFVNSDSDPIDDEGHGTHVAGIVSANGSVNGVAPDSKIIAIKSLDSNGNGWNSDIIAGIEYCTDIASEYNISVISMSLGSGGYSNYCDGTYSSYASAINVATSSGISVLVATGNEDNYTGIGSPSCIQNAIPITSTTKNDIMSTFANRNSLVELAAIGGTSYGEGSCTAMSKDPNRICSLNNGGGYISYSGTSMATPHVAGAFAIMNQYLDARGISKTPQEIESIFDSTGKQIYDSSSGRYYSRIDLYSALKSICTENIINNSWQNLGNITNCRLNNTIVYNLSRTQYDANNCALTQNFTYYLLNESQCDYCSPNPVNATWTEWRNLTSPECSILDKISQMRNRTEYDANNLTCYNITRLETDLWNSGQNKTHTEYQNISCDYCTPNWTSIIGNLFIWYNDTKSCYNKTNLTTDLYNRPKNITLNFTENLTEIYDNETNELIIEINTNISQNMSNLKILRQEVNDNYSYVIVKGINLTVLENVTKTIYLEKNLSLGLICLKDQEIENISEVSTYCNSTNEYLFNSCDKSLGNYSCETQDLFYKISGLKNSAVKEQTPFCGDQICNNGESCSSCSADCDSCPSSGGGGGGSGGGGSSGGGGGSSTISVTEKELENGINKKFSAGTKANLVINNQSHSLTLNKIINSSINLTLKSNPINFLMNNGEEKKINLTSADYYDLYIKVENVSKNYATIILKEINESINIKDDYGLSKENISQNEKEESSIKDNFEKNYLDYKIIIYFAIVLFLVILIKRFLFHKVLKDETEKKNQNYSKRKR